MPVLIRKDIIELAKDPKFNLLGNDYKQENIKGCSYDLRVGTIFKGKNIISVLKNKNTEIVELLPSEIITILTLEEVNLPLTICGTVFSMNSNSSSGLLILNPGHIDPGFKGPLSICAINLSNEIKRLNIGEDIITIYFHQLTNETVPYNNKFTDRNDYEIKMYKERFSKLSPSFFDLMKIEKYKPHLKDLVNEILAEKRRVRWNKILNYGVIYTTIIGFLIAAYFFIRSFQDKKIDNLTKEVNTKNQIIEEQRSKIENNDHLLILYKDSLKSFKKQVLLKKENK